jgi:hypothetical protein
MTLCPCSPLLPSQFFRQVSGARSSGSSLPCTPVPCKTPQTPPYSVWLVVCAPLLRLCPSVAGCVSGPTSPSQLSSIASPQSMPLPSKAELRGLTPEASSKKPHIQRRERPTTSRQVGPATGPASSVICHPSSTPRTQLKLYKNWM